MGVNVPVSYGYNANAAGTGRGFGGVSLAEFVTPTSTYLLSEVYGAQANITDPYESNSINTSAADYAASGNLLTSDSAKQEHFGGADSVEHIVSQSGPFIEGGYGGTQQGTQNAHTNGANFLLADGHVKWVTPRSRASCCTSPDGNSGPAVVFWTLK